MEAKSVFGDLEEHPPQDNSVLAEGRACRDKVKGRLNLEALSPPHILL